MIDEPLFDVDETLWRRRRCTTCGGALSVTHDHAYVVRRQRWVKIGATNNLRRRLGELARPAWRIHLLSPAGMDWTQPLETLVILAADGHLEHQLHQRFADQHAAGEWFHDGGPLAAWITLEQRARADTLRP